MANDKRVQLVVGALDEFSTTINRLQRDLKEMKGGLDDTSRLANNNNRSFGSFTGILGSFRGAIAGTGIALLARDLFQAGAAMDRLNNSMKAAGGNAADLKFLRDESQRLGLDLVSAGDAYVKLQAAARGTQLEGVEAQKVFSAVSEASTAMGLSAEQTNGALTALQQMISKGTVQAEELRGQLGERLPGAFQIAARAMGVSTAELGKMLEKGQVLAEDFVPKFSNQLQKEFPASAAAMDGATANLNRFKNGMLDLKVSVWDGGFRDVTVGLLGWAGDFAKGLAGVNKEFFTTITMMKRLHENGASWLDAAELARGDMVDGTALGSEEKAVGMAAANKRAMALLAPKSKPLVKSEGGDGHGGLTMTKLVDFMEKYHAARMEMDFETLTASGSALGFAATSMNREFLGFKPKGVQPLNLFGKDFSGFDQPAMEDVITEQQEMLNNALQTEIDMISAHYRAKQEMRELDIMREHQSGQQKLTIQNNYLNATQSLGQAAQALAGGQNKVLYALTQASALAVSFLSTEAAANAALAPPPIGLGPIAGAGLATSIRFAGYASMAAMAATTIASMSNMGKGGAGSSIGYGGGTPTSPIVTQPSANISAQNNPTVTVVIQGNVIGQDRWVEEHLAPTIKELATRRNVDFGLATA